MISVALEAKTHTYIQWEIKDFKLLQIPQTS